MAKVKKIAGFSINDYVVYPSHGVGKIIAIEEQEVLDVTLELFVIDFEKDKMTLRVPTAKVETVGLRLLSSPELVAKAMTTLKGRARVKRRCGHAVRRNTKPRSILVI